MVAGVDALVEEDAAARGGEATHRSAFAVATEVACVGEVGCPRACIRGGRLGDGTILVEDHEGFFVGITGIIIGIAVVGDLLTEVGGTYAPPLAACKAGSATCGKAAVAGVAPALIDGGVPDPGLLA